MDDSALTPTTPTDGESDSVFEMVEDVVDVVLADDLGPTEPEDRWERRQRILDSWTAIILALAAVATAWATFQAGEWAGSQSDAQSASAIQRSDANRAASDATSEEIVNSQMWLSWLQAQANGQKDRAFFFRTRFSPELAAAQKEWLGSVPVDAQGNPAKVPAGTPLDLPTYIVPSRINADALSAQAEASLAEADRASSNASRFVQLAVLLALVLFIASVATKFGAPKTQVILIILSLLLLIFCLVRMLLLPQLL